MKLKRQKSRRNDCNACEVRARHGLDGLCPGCASERTRGALATERAAKYEQSTCTCGHSKEEHPFDPVYPAATECGVCSCIAFEADVVGSIGAPLRAKGEAMTERTFPVLWQGPRVYLKALADNGCPREVPWDFVAEHAEQCLANHDQTPQRLSERGGLSPEEMLAAVKGHRLSYATALDYWHEPSLAVAMLKEAVETWKKAH